MFSNKYFQVIYDQCSLNVSCINIVLSIHWSAPGIANIWSIINPLNLTSQYPSFPIICPVSTYPQNLDGLWSITCFMVSFVQIGSTYKPGLLKDFINKMQVQESW